MSFDIEDSSSSSAYGSHLYESIATAHGFHNHRVVEPVEMYAFGAAEFTSAASSMTTNKTHDEEFTTDAKAFFNKKCTWDWRTVQRFVKTIKNHIEAFRDHRLATIQDARPNFYVNANTGEFGFTPSPTNSVANAMIVNAINSSGIKTFIRKSYEFSIGNEALNESKQLAKYPELRKALKQFHSRILLNALRISAKVFLEHLSNVFVHAKQAYDRLEREERQCSEKDLRVPLSIHWDDQVEQWQLD